MNFVYILSRKSFLTVTIQQLTVFIHRRFKYKVRIFHTDNEPALGEKFDTWMKGKGTLSNTRPDIPQPKVEPPNDQED